MANVNVKTQSVSILGVLGGALLRVWDGLVYLGESSARARVLRQLNSMSDEQLSSMGMTRADIVKRVFSDGYHI